MLCTLFPIEPFFPLGFWMEFLTRHTFRDICRGGVSSRTLTMQAKGRGESFVHIYYTEKMRTESLPTSHVLSTFLLMIVVSRGRYSESLVLQHFLCIRTSFFFPFPSVMPQPCTSLCQLAFFSCVWTI